MKTVADARQAIEARAAPLGWEEIALDDALGRFLADDVVAERALPGFDNSAMDGFAARAADLPGELPVAGAIFAGPSATATLAAGTAARIMTGAPLPHGADCVVMFEDADDRGGTVQLPAARAGQHVRRAGEDVAVGARLELAGRRIGAGEIGLLAALGHSRVVVGRRPHVAVLATGDELCELGSEPGPGQLIESNSHALVAMARDAGATAERLALVGDQPDELLAAIRRGLAADVLVTSGGVSAGDRDHVRAALAAAGVEVDFWKVAMKPGKPLVFGHVPGGALAFGLPGNPVSSMVVFELFVRPTLLRLAGAAAAERPRAEVVVTRAIAKAPGRAHFVRARLERSGAHLEATPHPRQGSGMLTSMVAVDALLELDAERGDLAAGDHCPALLVGPA
jgi:molybdopterin molybdotransferase